MRSTLSKHSELTQRIVAGASGAIIICSAVIFSEWTYFLVFFAICMFSMLEFYKLLGINGDLPLKTFGTLNGLLFFSLSFLIQKGLLSDKFYLLLFLGLSFVYVIILYKKADEKPFSSIAFTFLGIIYVAAPFALLNILVLAEGTYHAEIMMGMLAMIWASDSGAYFAGRSFGKTPLFPRISPKKTWEGSLGGATAALLTALAFSYFFDIFSVGEWLVTSQLIVVGGTYGDLVESLFKRSMHIKDSGSSIPGHGGFLDRFDSLLIATPVIVTYVRIF